MAISVGSKTCKTDDDYDDDDEAKMEEDMSLDEFVRARGVIGVPQRRPERSARACQGP
jgi:hypothetical protein